jgi:hypothetical protein
VSTEGLMQITQEEAYELQNLKLPSAMSSDRDRYWAQVVILPKGATLLLRGDNEIVTDVTLFTITGNIKPVTRSIQQAIVERHGRK